MNITMRKQRSRLTMLACLSVLLLTAGLIVSRGESPVRWYVYVLLVPGTLLGIATLGGTFSYLEAKQTYRLKMTKRRHTIASRLASLGLAVGSQCDYVDIKTDHLLSVRRVDASTFSVLLRAAYYSVNDSAYEIAYTLYVVKGDDSPILTTTERRRRTVMDTGEVNKMFGLLQKETPRTGVEASFRELDHLHTLLQKHLPNVKRTA